MLRTMESILRNEVVDVVNAVVNYCDRVRSKEANTFRVLASCPWDTSVWD